VPVDADRQDLLLFFFLFGQKTLQLPELLCAIRSPAAPVKDQDDILPALKIRERNSLSVHVFKSEVRPFVPDFNPVEVGGLQVGQLFGAQLGVAGRNGK